VGRSADFRDWLVSKLIETAGGMDVFADRASLGAAKDRVVSLDQVIEGRPDLIIGSWCGKKLRPERVAARPGFAQLPTVQHQDVYEIKSLLICSLARPLSPMALPRCKKSSQAGRAAAELGHLIAL
jgi:ABC-type Fe3+-hydroxamate transport system substrate-binding protein